MDRDTLRDRMLRAQARRWRDAPRERPTRVPAPGPGQESVWDYPRPPRVEPTSRLLRVEAGSVLVAESRRALRVLETAGAPTYYLPEADVDGSLLVAEDARSLCEWKGEARYWSVRVGGRSIPHAAWSYPDPFPEFLALRERFAFFPGVLACSVDGERASPQPGGTYGGWVTSDVVGPFKGAPGSERW